MIRSPVYALGERSSHLHSPNVVVILAKAGIHLGMSNLTDSASSAGKKLTG
jgi:hypothetical protein